MTDIELLGHALNAFAGIDELSFALSKPYWQKKRYQKGELYNEYKNVCRHLGFILDGVFRAYHVKEDTGEEKNVFFSPNIRLLFPTKASSNNRPVIIIPSLWATLPFYISNTTI